MVVLSLTVLLSGCGEDGPAGPGTGDGIIFINGYPDEPRSPWRLTMPGGYQVSGVGDSTLVGMPEGSYSITWHDLPDFHLPSPNPHRQYLGASANMTFTGIYTPIQYTYPHVPWVEAGPSDAPEEVKVSWLWYLSQDHPTDHYEIALSLSGPITSENWDQAEMFGVQPHFGNLVAYHHIFSAADGLIPGQQVWVAVIAVDAEGWTTDVVESPTTLVSSAWWATGRVHDHLGHPLAGVTIGCDQAAGAVVSGPEGSYTLGPLVDIAPVVFSVDPQDLTPFPGTDRWFAFTGTPYTYPGNGQLDILVLPVFTMDDQCTTYGGDFLTFFRYLTKTNTTDYYRPDHHFCSWHDYPVKVFVPDHVRPEDGLDFGAQVRSGVSIWNLLTAMQIVTTEGVSEAEADVLVVFDDLGSLTNGVTLLAEPAGLASHFGYVDPVRIQVGINNVILPTAQRVQETSLHEMGHALGLYRHVQGCTQVGYLMSLTSAGMLDDGPENAAHPDEVHAMQIIRHLPRWMDLSGFH